MNCECCGEPEAMFARAFAETCACEATFFVLCVRCVADAICPGAEAAQ